MAIHPVPVKKPKRTVSQRTRDANEAGRDEAKAIATKFKNVTRTRKIK